MNSKQKGSSFERTICKTLSKWITNGERDDILWRSIGSGSYNTNRLKKNKESNSQEGDITYIDPIGKEFIDNVSIECKSYKHIELYKLFNGKSEIIKWYNKLIKETNKHPLIIFKSNNKDILIATNKEIYYTILPATYIEVNKKIFIFKLEELLNEDYHIFIKELINE